MTDYGPDLVAHFLLNELRAEGYITQVERDQWVYRGEGDSSDYLITLRATPIKKVRRLID